MNEEKRVRIAAAITVNVILLIVILAAVVIYQLVAISALRDQRLKIQSEIAQIEQAIEDEEDMLEYYKSDKYLFDKAYEFGFKNGN